MDAESRLLGAQLASPRQRDLHNQVESDWTWHQQSQLEFDTCERQLRLDSQTVGRGEGRVHSHS